MLGPKDLSWFDLKYILHIIVFNTFGCIKKRLSIMSSNAGLLRQRVFFFFSLFFFSFFFLHYSLHLFQFLSFLKNLNSNHSHPIVLKEKHRGLTFVLQYRLCISIFDNICFSWFCHIHLTSLHGQTISLYMAVTQHVSSDKRDSRGTNH